jgi:hypothetical protein
VRAYWLYHRTLSLQMIRVCGPCGKHFIVVRCWEASFQARGRVRCLPNSDLTVRSTFVRFRETGRTGWTTVMGAKRT